MPVYEMTSDDDELGLMEKEPKPNRQFSSHKTHATFITMLNLMGNLPSHSVNWIMIKNSV